MATKVTTSDRGDVSVVKVSGTVALDFGSREMYQAIADQLQTGRQKIVVDLSEANNVDSSGLGYLVAAYTKAKNTGGELVIANPAPRIRSILHEMTKLDRVIRVFDSVDEAVTAVGKTP